MKSSTTPSDPKSCPTPFRATPFRALVLAGALALGACSGMSPRDRDTAVGAAVGGAAGPVMTDSVLGTVGGAAVGGVVGNQVGKRRHGDWRRRRHAGPCPAPGGGQAC